MTFYLIAAALWIIGIPIMTGVLMGSKAKSLPKAFLYLLGIFWPVTLAVFIGVITMTLVAIAARKLYDFGYKLAESK